jgi:hypothetical protein
MCACADSTNSVGKGQAVRKERSQVNLTFHRRDTTTRSGTCDLQGREHSKQEAFDGIGSCQRTPGQLIISDAFSGH